MGNDVFSNFAIPATTVQKPVVNNQSTEKVEAPVAAQTTAPATTESNTKTSGLDKFKSIAPIVLPLAAIPVTALISYKIAGKTVSNSNDALQKSLDTLREAVALNKAEVSKLIEVSEKSITEQATKNSSTLKTVMTTLASVAGLGVAYEVGKDDDDKKISKGFIDTLKSIGDKSDAAVGAANKAVATSGKALNGKYTRSDIGGIPLLTTNSGTKNNGLYNKAIEQIQNTGKKFLTQGAHITPITSEKPVIWSITSEFSPIKEGGLGNVPVDVQNNVTKLGVQIPTFIPMYQQEGLCAFQEHNGKYSYHYKDQVYDLKKVASFDMDAYKGGSSKSEKVEIFVSDTQDEHENNKQLVFIKNDNYFNGTIYEASNKTEEPEKFAFFSKAVYEFLKLKTGADVKNKNVFNKTALDSIKEPDALMLNDWQASAVAALARYKAPMESAYGKLSTDASDKISNMNIITLGHNVMYQGSSANDNDAAQRVESTSNILNTLFDGYTYDIVNNAKSGASETNKDDPGLANLDNILMMNANNADWAHTNLLNMGISLSDYFHPVSKNYAQELLKDDDAHKQLSGELQWSLAQRNKTGSLYGIINGNDFDKLSIEANLGVIKNKQTGLDYKTYNKSSTKEEVMAARSANKENFYNNYMVPFTLKNDANNKSDAVEAVRKVSGRLEFVSPNEGMKLPELSSEELADTPILSSLGRFVSQKGIDIMCDAIDMLYKNWETDFPADKYPNRKKPLFYIAGSDGEGGRQRKFVEDLINNKLSKDDKNRVVFAHGFAPMHAINSASDFFVMPSRFEPCGLTQGEAMALGTPVIASAVGGIVDTVNRDGKTNGILTDKDQPLSAKAMYEVMKKGLEIYYNDKEKYSNMVMDALGEDFSWIQPGKQGPVYDYLEKIGVNMDTIPDVADLNKSATDKTVHPTVIKENPADAKKKIEAALPETSKK